MNAASSLYTEIFSIITNHEKAKSTEEVNKEGIFYTPYRIAFKMANDCLESIIRNLSYDDLLKIKILDPSCGAGVFLVACFHVLINKLSDLNLNTYQNRKEILLNCIYANDKDYEALITARDILFSLLNFNNISYETSPLVDPSLISAFSKNMTNSDFLLNFAGAAKVNQTSPDLHLPDNKKLKDAQFDLIIGNPPYGQSRDEKLTREENSALKIAFKKYELGKVNKYLAFMAKSLEILSDKGTMSFIVPNAWLGITSASKLREIFTTEGSFETVEQFGKSAFPHLEVETLIFRYKKSVKIEKIRLRQYADANEFRISEESSFPKKLCSAENEFIIPAKWNSQIEFLKEHFNKNCFPLCSDNSPFTSLIALQAYSAGKGTPPQTKETVKLHSFHSREKISEDYIPYLEGSNISRFNINWSKTFLKYGPHLAEPQKLSRFEGPRILVREILNVAPYNIIAAYTDKTYLYNKSVLHIISRGSAGEIEFLALLAILNSSLGGYIVRNFGRKSQRKLFPKIVNADLKSFPIISNFREITETLAGLSAEASDCISDQSKFSLLQKKIDQMVLQYYGLTKITLGT